MTVLTYPTPKGPRRLIGSTDEALALAARLLAQGVTVTLRPATASDEARATGPTLRPEEVEL